MNDASSGARVPRAILLFLVALVTLALGCSDGAAEGAYGVVEVVGTTSQALGAADVARVRVTISGPGVEPPVAQDLVKAGGTWQGVISRIPAGADRTFTAEAFTATGELAYASTRTGITISRSSRALVSMTLQQVTPPPAFGNVSPILDALVSSSVHVAPGETVDLAAYAHDPNAGDTLSYAWSSDAGGAFASTASPLTSWTAPATEATATVTVRVTDHPHLAVTAFSFQIQVSSTRATGTASVTTTINNWPIVERVVADPGRLDVGGTTALSVRAHDPDVGPLTFLWSTDCTGHFDTATSATPKFTLTALAPTGACSFGVLVTDARQGTNTGTIGITTGPGPGVTPGPAFDGAFQSAEFAVAGDTVVLRVTSAAPAYPALDVTWSTDQGALGAPAATSTSSEVVWTAPACGPGIAPHVVATLRDGDLAASHAFAIPVYCETAAQTFTNELDVDTRWWSYMPANGFDPSLGTLAKVRVRQQVGWSFGDGAINDYYEHRLYVLGPGGHLFVGGETFGTNPDTVLARTYDRVEDATAPGWTSGPGALTVYVESFSNTTPHHYASSVALSFLYVPGVASGLLGYWPFDGDGADASGAGRDLTLVGAPTFAAGRRGQALDLHGDPSQYATRLVNDPALDLGDADFTIQAWVRHHTTQGFVLAEKLTGMGEQGWTFGGSYNTAGLFYTSAGYAAKSADLVTGVWHHLVAVRSGGQLTLTYDGIAGTPVAIGTIPTSVNPLLVGRRNDSDARDAYSALDGSLDDLAIWSRALGPAEIAYLYNRGAGAPVR